MPSLSPFNYDRYSKKKPKVASEMDLATFEQMLAGASEDIIRNRAS
jgi:hypothetical protein